MTIGGLEGTMSEEETPQAGPPEPAALRPESKGATWAAEVHVPADVVGLPDQAAYVKEQVKSLGLSGGKVTKEEDHPDGGKRVRVEG